uniref:CCHC-type domain-containing protein n=1 Tax=Cajanus cajan TaxID=3821 RepID=A0A151S177_CAJCA|nr:hypothetical protein KK1_029737 [Cajanus cajan]
MKKHRKKSRSSHSQYTSPNESMNQGDHYQPPPRRTIRPREVKVDLPQFFGKDDVEMRKSSYKRDSSHSSSLKKDSKREGKPFDKKKNFEPSKSLVIEKDKGKGKDTLHTSSRTSDIKCFKCLGRGHIVSQCPTKKVMIMRGHDIYSSQDEATTSSSNSGEEASDEEENVESTFSYEGEILMIRRLLNNQPSGTQREKIFHTRCKVLNNACSLIVDSGS